MKKFIFISIVLILLSIHSCQSDRSAKQISVFCAAGLSELIGPISDSLAENTGSKVVLNLASSGTLTRQIERGNSAHIYISASKKWADYAEKLNLFEARKELCQNRLVFIAPKNNTRDSVDFTSKKLPAFNGYLSMGDPAHVPAGEYAKQALTKLGWWETISKNNKILPGKDVRSALMQVELGECELGVVYYSDALSSKKVKTVGLVPEELHDPVIFYILLAKNAPPAAREYYDALTKKKYEASFIKFGLTPL